MTDEGNGTRTRWGVVAVAFGVVFAMGLVDNARGPAYPAILAHFRASATAGSLMFAVASLGSVIVSWTGRAWLVRFGALAAARFFSALLVVGCVGMGAAGYLSIGLPGLVAASLVFGLGATGCSVCGNALIGLGAAPAQRRRLLSGVHAMYGASSLLAPLAVAYGARAGLDWRRLFFALAIVPLLIGALALKVRRVTPRTSDASSAIAAAPPRRMEAAAACAMLALYVVAEVCLSSRLPQLVESHWKWGSAPAALCLSGFFALLLAGRTAFAVIRFPGSSVRWLAASASLSLVAYVVGLFAHPAVLALCGLTMSVFFPTAMAWIQDRFGLGADRMIASAIAAVGLGLVLAHFGVGVLTDAVGIRNALLVGPVCLLGVLALLRGLRAS
jgi:FHS family glucose/mannose:H+ symporter-like MFS transporter